MGLKQFFKRFFKKEKDKRFLKEICYLKYSEVPTSGEMNITFGNGSVWKIGIKGNNDFKGGIN